MQLPEERRFLQLLKALICLRLILILISEDITQILPLRLTKPTNRMKAFD